MQMRQRDVAALDAKYAKGRDAKAKMMLRDDVAAGRRQLLSESQSVQSVRATTASAWIMQPPPDCVL